MELSQLDKIYLSNLVNYNKVVVQRNKLLKQLQFSGDSGLVDMLDVWDMQLVRYGSEIIKRRMDFIDNINSIIRPVHSKLSGNKEILNLRYIPCTTTDNFKDEVIRSRERDIKFKMTNVGPHKDDVAFFINDKDVRKYGSQGQQRTCALSLKLAEIELVKKVINDTPVLLLDDVLSELDANRQNFLLDSIGDIQTIITCTGLDEFVNNRFSINRIFKVVNGVVSNEN